jgi:phosphoserine phosphatase RsbU/P
VTGASNNAALKLELILKSMQEMEALAASPGDLRSRGKLLLRSLLGTAMVSRGAVFRYLPASGALQPHVATNCLLPRVVPRMPPAVSETWIRDGRPVVLRGASGTVGEWLTEHRQIFVGMGANLVFPMVAQARFVGMVVLGPKFMGQRFQPEDFHTLALLVRPLTMAYLSHELFRGARQTQFQLRRKILELETLGDVGRTITSLRGAERLRDEILMRASSILDASHGALVLVDEHCVAQVASTFGFELDVDVPENVAEFLARLNPDGSGTQDLSAFDAPIADERVLAVPIRTQTRMLGLICVANKETRFSGYIPFTADDAQLLVSFASLVAVALENVELHASALEKERIEKEIEVAAEIQRGLLPTELPSIPGYRCLAFTQPCRAIGGDFYDCFEMPDGKLAFVIADVSGKSVPAALLVSTLHASLHTLRDSFGDPLAVMHRLNNVICESSAENKFITMVLFVLDSQRHRLQLINAGHNYPLLAHADGAIERVESSGFPLGLFPDARYGVEEKRLRPGSILIAYTDGISETRSPGQEEYGETRLLDYVLGTLDDPSTDVTTGMLARLSAFRGTTAPEDDITMVVLRRLPT